MIIYRIRNKVTGLFSTGGQVPTWTVTGKIWTNQSGLSSHLGLVDKKYSNCEIIVYELTETEVETISIEKYVFELKHRRELELARKSRATKKRQLEFAQQELDKAETALKQAKDLREKDRNFFLNH